MGLDLLALAEFGVARAGGGYATVVIKKFDGRTRAIFFRMGRPIGADVSEAEDRLEFRAASVADTRSSRAKTSYPGTRQSLA